MLKAESIKLDSINTSQITDFSYLFCVYDGLESCVDSAFNRKDFKGIESWNLKSLKFAPINILQWAFYNATNFNQNIKSWNLW